MPIVIETYEELQARVKRLGPKDGDRCWFCKGLGRVSCSICDGSKDFRMAGDGIQDAGHFCMSCDENGKVICRPCNATGIYSSKKK